MCPVEVLYMCPQLHRQPRGRDRDAHAASLLALLAQKSANTDTARDTGNRVGEAAMLMQLAQACAQLNDLPQALEHLEQCLELRKSVNDKRGQADALIKIVYVHSALRNIARARDAYEESYSLRLDSGDEAGQVECLNARGLLAMHEGKLNEVHEKSNAIHRNAALVTLYMKRKKKKENEKNTYTYYCQT